MTDWLLTQLPSYLLVATFGCVAIWESFAPRRPFAAGVGIRWVNNVALTALGFLLARLCLPLAAFSLAVLAQQRGWGLFNWLDLPPWLSCAVGVMVIDLAGYGQHRLFHAVPLFWRFHQIHHSDLDVDCGTAVRHHPVEILLGRAFDLALIATIGIPPLAVLLGTTLVGVASVFNHGNVALPSVADRLLRGLLVTPDMHRIHHSADVEESARNYAMLFPWWDRLFGTYRREPLLGHEQMALGIAEARNASDVTMWKLLVLPFQRAPAPVLAGVQPSSQVVPPVGVPTLCPKEEVWL